MFEYQMIYEKGESHTKEQYKFHCQGQKGHILLYVAESYISGGFHTGMYNRDKNKEPTNKFLYIWKFSL